MLKLIGTIFIFSSLGFGMGRALPKEVKTVLCHDSSQSTDLWLVIIPDDSNTNKKMATASVRLGENDLVCSGQVEITDIGKDLASYQFLPKESSDCPKMVFLIDGKKKDETSLKVVGSKESLILKKCQVKY